MAGKAAQMVMKKMPGKPKFGSPEWRAMYGKKKKNPAEPDSEEMKLPGKGGY